jgi:tetratricopeptide (TPR) repeat protein
LLGRALALIRPLRLEINLELDLAEAQQTPEAQAAIADHAARRAREIGDRAAETIALLVAAKTQLEAAPQPDVIDDLERLGKEALDLLEPGTDDAARGRVWYALAEAANYRGQFEKRALAAEQALRCFELSRAHHFELAGLPWALIQGPRAADEALETLEPFLAANPAPYALFGRAHLLAMLNRFDEAWELVLPISDRQRELSEGPELDIQLGDIAALGGDYKLAIRHLRQACNTLERLGMNAHLSSYAPLLGRCLCELGRYGDAEPFALLGRDLGAEQDLTTQTYWRQVQARVHASRGDHAEAERLAREAVSISERTDGLNLQADAHCDLADVLAQAGKPGEASEALDQALERYKRKQNLAMIAQVQPRRDALQDELAAHGSTGTP